MKRRRIVSINFDGRVSVERREDGWAAYMEPFGITVYGDTEEEVQGHLRDGATFFLQTVCEEYSLARVGEYFDSHGISHSVSFSENPAPNPALHAFRGEALVHA